MWNVEAGLEFCEASRDYVFTADVIIDEDGVVCEWVNVRVGTEFGGDTRDASSDEEALFVSWAVGLGKLKAQLRVQYYLDDRDDDDSTVTPVDGCFWG